MAVALFLALMLSPFIIIAVVLVYRVKTKDRTNPHVRRIKENQ